MFIISIKKILKDISEKLGYEIRKKKKTDISNPGKLTFEFDYEPSTSNRPIGDINTFLNDIKKRGYNCKYVFDVGANQTDYSRLMKKIFPGANFLMIEPLAEMEEKMRDFCNEFKGSEYVVKGVGAKAGKKVLTLIGDSYSGSTMMVKELEGFKKANLQREVDVVTIDSLVEENKWKFPDFVKIDVQGFELEVLKGAESLFGNTEIFIIEVSLFKFNEYTPGISEIIGFMSERNYVVYDIPGFLRRPYDGALGQLDICFIHAESFLKRSINWFK